MADIEIIGVAVRKRITWPTEREPMAVGLQWPNYADYSTYTQIHGRTYTQIVAFDIDGDTATQRLQCS